MSIYRKNQEKEKTIKLEIRGNESKTPKECSHLKEKEEVTDEMEEEYHRYLIANDFKTG